MKHLLIALALTSTSAMATGMNQNVDVDVHSYAKASSQAKAQASAFGAGFGYGGAGGTSTATGGTSTATGGTSIVNVEGDHHPKNPVNSAIAPSVGTGDDCQIATPSSIAGSILILSLSGTTGVHYNDICYAYKRGQFDVADRMMCEKSAAYAKANPACAK